MTGIDQTDGDVSFGELALRAPRQRRTREQWERILDAGVQLLEQGGYEAFTIPALCDAAGVPPRALYARADSKDVLFLAVYERGMTRVRAAEEVFEQPEAWNIDDDAERIAWAVRRLTRIFIDNGPFLRAVVLISGAHPEVRHRGEAYRQRIANLFDSVLAPVSVTSMHQDPMQAREFCFSLVFAAMVVRTAYGPGFGPEGDRGLITEELVGLAQRYLLD